MRRMRGLSVAALLVAVGVSVAGCETFDGFNLDFLDTKKKLPGERKPVFPEGVPGVAQGVPPEYLKNNQAQPQPPDPAAAAVQQIVSEPEAKPKPVAKPKPKPKPVVRQTQAPAQPAAPAQQSVQQPQAQSAPWPQQQPQAAWPAPPNPNQFSR